MLQLVFDHFSCRNFTKKQNVWYNGMFGRNSTEYKFVSILLNKQNALLDLAPC